MRGIQGEEYGMKKEKRNEKGRNKKHLLYGVLLIGWIFFVAGCGLQEEPPEKSTTPAIPPKATGEAKPTESPEEVTEQEEPKLTDMPEQDDSDLDANLLKLLAGMSTEEKVGQMFLVRCPKEAETAVSEYKVGGFVLFARDFEGETKTSMREKIASYQEDAGIPMIISVDEEGGPVVRISKYPAFRESAFLSPRELYAVGGMARIAEDAKEKAGLLSELGINVNLAPVCDISRSKGAFLYERSFGGTAEETAEYVETVVKTAKTAGLGSVLKHFPGYGDNADTHKGIVYDSRAYEVYKENDFKPFLAGIEAGAEAVMVSHNIVQCMDRENPASLSPEVHRILREELSFEGVILTDDLYMDAIQDFTGKENAAVAAVLAGNDMLCCTDFEVQIPAVLAAVEDGRISEEQIDTSVLRILKWKAELGLLE